MCSDAWITTFTGKKFHLFDPRPEEICIEDIAHSLSLQCRFTGHVKSFYSVAQHSVLVSRECRKFPVWGLLHDAAEAYIGDMSAPLKHTSEMAIFRETEARIMSAIAKRFNLTPEEPREVKTADRRLLLSEARDLLGSCTGWYSEYRPFPQSINPWGPRLAEIAFLERFCALVPSAEALVG